MGLTEGHQAKTVWENPAEIVRALAPENPVMVFAPTILQARATADSVHELKQVHRTLALSRARDAAGIRHFVLKGVKSAMMAFGRYAPSYNARSAASSHAPANTVPGGGVRPAA